MSFIDLYNQKLRGHCWVQKWLNSRSPNDVHQDFVSLCYLSLLPHVLAPFSGRRSLLQQNDGCHRQTETIPPVKVKTSISSSFLKSPGPASDWTNQSNIAIFDVRRIEYSERVMLGSLKWGSGTSLSLNTEFRIKVS